MQVTGALLALLALASNASAARKSWQPELKAPTSHSLRSNATGASKRWLAVNTGSGSGDTHLWPDKTIKYGFESLADMRALGSNIVQAVNLWDAMGLSKTEYKWELVSPSKCKEDRVNCLLVQEKPMFQASIGKIPASKEFDGPFMWLDKETRNERSLVLNYAHEIGHVWGLQHEHQNPAFWSAPFDPNGKRQGTAFNNLNFRCTNVPNYDAAKARAQDTTREDYQETDYELMCRSVAIAVKLKWAEGAAYLPFPTGYWSEKSDLSQGVDDVDWNSIMIYPTKLTKYPVLKKPDGTDIPMGTGPSNKDVMGIQRMYNSNSQTRNDDPLLNSGANSKQSVFKKLFCGCCSA